MIGAIGWKSLLRKSKSPPISSSLLHQKTDSSDPLEDQNKVHINKLTAPIDSTKLSYTWGADQNRYQRYH